MGLLDLFNEPGIPNEDGNSLMCPVCGWNYVHPQKPIFSGEYAESGADYSITIPFWCEGGHKYSVVIHHHEGQSWIKTISDKQLENLPALSMNCPKCSSEAYTEKRGKHIGLFCRSCGFIKFISQPWQGFVMPIGKHKGKTLLEIKKIDKEYLRWVVYNISSKSIASRAKEALSGELEHI